MWRHYKGASTLPKFIYGLNEMPPTLVQVRRFMVFAHCNWLKSKAMRVWWNYCGQSINHIYIEWHRNETRKQTATDTNKWRDFFPIVFFYSFALCESLKNFHKVLRLICNGCALINISIGWINWQRARVINILFDTMTMRHSQSRTQNCNINLDKWTKKSNCVYISTLPITEK